MQVAEGMSGGVDSSVAALLLKEQGHEVTGVSMSIWDGPEEKTCASRHSCYGPDEQSDIEEARAVCSNLDIPFRVFDCAKEYKEIVLGYFRSEYASGRTPNPCVKCNHLVKLGALPQMARQAGLSFDCFGTGHYAQIVQDGQTKRYFLEKAKDLTKDQSYFLYRLSQEQLSTLLLPLGRLLKTEVRDIAKARGLPVAEREESQDFYCGNYQDLLNFKARDGEIVDKSGTLLGRHKGVWNYTLGQRKGLGIAHKEPLYVVKLDPNQNTVVVGPKEEVLSTSFLVHDLNWIAIEELAERRQVAVKIRSAHKEAPATIEPLPENKVKVTLTIPQEAITPGQSAVFYAGNTVLGGGIIEESS
jgi:tRNA-uridine 2-sulfurtransferase